VIALLITAAVVVATFSLMLLVGSIP